LKILFNCFCLLGFLTQVLIQEIDFQHKKANKKGEDFHLRL